MQEKLIAYYNKFNEDKRLLSRHGQVEFQTTMRYIQKYLPGDWEKGCVFWISEREQAAIVWHLPKWDWM